MLISDGRSDVGSSDLMLAAVVDVRGVFSIARLPHGAELFQPHDVRKSYDGVQRCAQFVAHVRKEFGFRPARLFGGGLGPAQLGVVRKRVFEGKSVSVRVDLGGRRIIKKKTTRK